MQFSGIIAATCFILATNPTNRWTGATGSVFRIIIGPAQLLGNAVARSTPPLGKLASLMNRIVPSLFVGFAITVGVSILVTLILFRGDSDAIVTGLLFWPAFLMDKLGLGLGCADADSVSDKLSCIRTALLIDAALYPAMICFSAYVVRRMAGRSERLRQSRVAS